MYYIACNNCKMKIKAAEGRTYKCFLCKKNVVATPKRIVVLTVSDHTGIIKVESIAEQITQTAAERISGLANLEEFSDRFCLILLRRTFGQVNENQRRHLLMAYHDETINLSGINAETSSSSSSAVDKGKAAELLLSPLSDKYVSKEEAAIMNEDSINEPETTSPDEIADF